VLRPVQKQVLAILQNPARAIAASGTAGALPAGSTAAAGDMSALPMAALPDGRTPEVTQTIQLKRDLVNRIKSDPESASRLVQNWVRESETAQGQD